MADAPRYRAFLSYSRRNTDVARRIHTRIEGWPIARGLRGRQTAMGVVPKSLGNRIFLDALDFVPGQGLDAQTIANLNASASLILLASPDAAGSYYVNLEVLHFRQRHPDLVFPLIVAAPARATEADFYPPALRFDLESDGTLSDRPSGLLAADIRPSGNDTKAGDGEDWALAKIVAQLLGLPRQEVYDLEKQRQKRARLVWGLVAAAMLVLALIGGGALWQYRQASLTVVEQSREITDAKALARQLLGISPANAAPGQEQSLTATITALAAGARTDPRQAQALALLRQGKTQEAVSLLLSVAETAKANSVAERKRAAEAYRQTAGIAGLRDPKQARALYAEAAALDPDDVDGMFWHGYLESSGGNLPEADRAFRLVLANGEPGSHDSALIWANYGLGDVLAARGNLNAAKTAFAAGGAIAERLARYDPGNAGWQHDLSVSFERIGDVLRDQGKGDDALKAYRDSSAIFERLARDDPGNAGWQRDLSVSFDRIGDVLRDQGKGDDALKAFRDSLAIRERLARDDPRNAGWQRDLSVSFNKIGDVLRDQGRGDDAIKAYRDSLAIAERLARDDPRNAGWQRDLSVSFDRIGNVLRDQGKGDDALKAFRDSLAIREGLTRGDPGNAGWQRDLAVSYSKLALVERGVGKMADALAHLRRGRAIMARLVAMDPNHAGWRGDLAWFDGQIAGSGSDPLANQHHC